MTDYWNIDSLSDGDNGRRVLFLNPVKQNEFEVIRIHMGLSLLGTILKEQGHVVLVMDYAFLDSVDDKLLIPDVEDVIRDFQPDVVGISVFSYLYNESQEFIERVSQCCEAPIMVGGPHTTFFTEDFINDDRISYIVLGEAESVIVDLVENACYESPPRVIPQSIPVPEMIPKIDLSLVFGSKYLRQYQIQLSRGCPYLCSFCNIQQLAQRRMRYRDLESCVQEIVDVKRDYPSIISIAITDDCPTVPKERFKDFLRLLADANIDCKLWVDNMRANFIDDELLVLYKRAKGTNICLGIESGNKQVFDLINKGQKLDAVFDASNLIRKHGLRLGGCFVIGLPEDTMESHQDSINLAKQLKLDYVFWNMCVPWPATNVRRWFDEHGEVGDPRNFSTLISSRVEFDEPICSSPEFTKEERIRAWLMANLETHLYFRHIRDLFKIMVLSIKYKLFRSFVVYLYKTLHRVYIPKLMKAVKETIAKIQRIIKKVFIA